MLKYDFDTLEEYMAAREHLEDYHDCDKCHGKIVMICSDGFGNTKCGYCGKIVRYPTMTHECFKKVLESEIILGDGELK